MRTIFRCDECGRTQDFEFTHRCGPDFAERVLRPEEIVGPEDIPEGVCGRARIEHLVFEKDTQVGSWHSPSFMKAGSRLVRLYHDGVMWMSNTPDEVRSQHIYIPSNLESPTILIGGLGLGSVISLIAGHRIPAEVVVVEIEPDVISLVAPTYAHLPWLTIVEGDIREYGRIGAKDRFDVAWVDIWGDYSTDDLEDMWKVRRSLRRVMKPGTLGHMGSRVQLWKEGELLVRRGR